MNRKGNLLNGGLLGSSSKSSQIYIAAQQWCEAQVAGILHVGRQLANTVGISGLESNTILRAGRKLASLVQGGVSATVKLFGMFAVPLVPVAQELTADVTVNLKKIHPIALTPETSSFEMVTAGVITNWHPEHLTSDVVCSLEGMGTLTRMGMLKGVCPLEASTAVILTEASRIRAPSIRISKFPVTNRTSIIRGI